MAIGHEQAAQVFLVELAARCSELSDSTDWRSFRRLAASVGVDFRVDEHDIDVGVHSQDVVQTAVADIISPAVAAIHPDGLLDDVFFMSQDFFLQVCSPAGEMSSHQFFDVCPADAFCDFAFVSDADGIDPGFDGVVEGTVSQAQEFFRFNADSIAPLYLPQRRKIFLLFRIFPIDFILTLVYNKSIKKGGDKVKKKKKKPTKSRVDVRTIVITAIVDFLVGLALLIIDKLT